VAAFGALARGRCRCAFPVSLPIAPCCDGLVAGLYGLYGLYGLHHPDQEAAEHERARPRALPMIGSMASRHRRSLLARAGDFQKLGLIK